MQFDHSQSVYVNINPDASTLCLYILAVLIEFQRFLWTHYQVKPSSWMEKIVQLRCRQMFRRIFVRKNGVQWDEATSWVSEYIKS